MQIWLDVLDANGNKLGDGPIMTATDWQSTRRLDQAGTFSFSMPASDPRANLLKHKRHVRCWAAPVGGIISEVGSGIIDVIEIATDANGATVLRVSGDDLLRDLANRSVGNLSLYSDNVYDVTRLEAYYYQNAAWEVLPLPPCHIDFDTYPIFIHYFVVEHTSPFNHLHIDMGLGVNTDPWPITAEYYNSTEGQWISIDYTDTTNQFRQDGVIDFDIPADWGTLTRDGTEYYCIRFSPITHFDLDGLTLTVREPSFTGLAEIMACAPEGWHLDPIGGHLTTLPAEEGGAGVLLDFSGDSVLAALSRLAEATGEHFRLAASGKRITWLWQADVTDGVVSSGLRAVAAGGDEPVNPRVDNPFALYITSISQTTDSYDLVTRLYPYGGGQGDGRVTLQYTTRTPIGLAVTLSTTNNYLENTTATALYGRCDGIMDAPDVVYTNFSAGGKSVAANTLFDLAYNELKRKCQLQYAYRLGVLPSKYPLWPGQTIHVEYVEWVDAYQVMSINRDLWVLEVTSTISADGLYTTELVVATVDYWPENDASFIAKVVRDQRRQRSANPGTSALTSAALGTPTRVIVQNGQLVAVKHTTPAGDGTYDLSAHPNVQIQGGIVVQVY